MHPLHTVNMVASAGQKTDRAALGAMLFLEKMSESELTSAGKHPMQVEDAACKTFHRHLS